MKKITCSFLSLILLSSCSYTQDLKEVGSTFVFSIDKITYKIQYVDYTEKSLIFDVNIINESEDIDYPLYIRKSKYISSILINDKPFVETEKNDRYYGKIECEDGFFKIECYLSEQGSKIFNSKCDIKVDTSYSGVHIFNMKMFYYIKIIFNE